MNPKYLLFLPLGLVCANPIEARGKNNGCPAANGGCSGTCVTSAGGRLLSYTVKGMLHTTFLCGRVFNGNSQQLTSVMRRKSGGACTAYGDYETFCPYWA
ncbi:hypothetical protein FOXG_22777 [Fusarium oxysporum f. sp. lycopersici 4287]|uniref:Secreted in xylem 14 n=1 Tax=Fusarium oxysporum f. sp. lycopersici (strain 4287 / CBS 123668 / FGSC 9935 / NRRL 34936) TaxID=426428 RepID=A0A0J9WBM4_FUSO4|nr:uncharacterized protein FOXG_22777 [Fusarium oxysporum f. sp. lycopersici 4287]KNB20223.1 hypothetical protein FOXG_22777 [Fusarium oxysporum f. sp. lycopersici 4287]